MCVLVRVEQGVAARLADTKAAREMQALQDFMKMFTDDPERAYYGFKVHSGTMTTYHPLSFSLSSAILIHCA